MLIKSEFLPPWFYILAFTLKTLRQQGLREGQPVMSNSPATQALLYRSMYSSLQNLASCCTISEGGTGSARVRRKFGAGSFGSPPF